MKKSLVILIALLFLSSCSGEKCIEADDFGFSNIVVSARYSDKELSQQVGQDQVAPWRDSKLKLNGRPLTILVKGWEQGKDANQPWDLSAWSAWYGKPENSETLSEFCEKLQECRFVDNLMCSDDAEAKISNAPCIFKNGVGLYGLVTINNYNPNMSYSSQLKPDGLTFHLGDKNQSYQMTDIDKDGKTRNAGGIIYKYESASPNIKNLNQKYVNGSLYFKIVDKFYDDNNGQYRVSIKSGVTETEHDPIVYVTKLVRDFIFGVDKEYGLIRKIYMGIVKNPGYKLAVSALLTLYVIFTALSYLSGNIEITQTELIVRIMKMAIVSALLSSEYSWSFFNDYLFVFFIGGVEQILAMITEAGATGPGSPGIIALMMAPQTISKLLSLLFVDWNGLIYIILFIIALFFTIMVFFESTVIYLSALIAVGLIITMGPIFICFLLFSITRSLFESWLKQLISYAIQPIILFTGLIFISFILRQEIYASLGFRVCKIEFPKLGQNNNIIGEATRKLLGYSAGDSLFYWWFPMPMKGEQFTRTKVNIPIPIDHIAGSDNNIVGAKKGEFCEAYGCIGPRYIDLPFLDPINDQRRINHFWNGKFVQFDGLFLIFIALYLLHKFNGLTVSIAKFITGTSGNLTDLTGIGNNAIQGMQNNLSGAVGSAASSIKSLASKAAPHLKSRMSGEKVQDDKIAGTNKAGALAGDKLNITGANRGVSASDQINISKKAEKTILSDVKIQTGLDKSDVKSDASIKYDKALASKLRELDPKINSEKAIKIVNQLSNEKFANLSNEFAKIKYGKDYDKLSNTDKAEIDNLIKKKPEGQDVSLREMANDARTSKEFKNAYDNAYQKLVNKGEISIKGTDFVRNIDKSKAALEINETDKQNKEKIEKMRSGYGALEGDLDKLSPQAPLPTPRNVENLDSNIIDNLAKEIKDNEVNGNLRMQTKGEIALDEQRASEHELIIQKNQKISQTKGENIISPEFLAKAEKNNDPALKEYKESEKLEVRDKVYSVLTRGEEPILKGEHYTKNYASDTEMKTTIDKISTMENEIIDNDPFIERQERYEIKFERANADITSTYDTLSKHYNRDDIKPEEMPELLRQYNEIIYEHSPQESQKDLEKLETSIRDFTEAQEILIKIDERKEDISREVQNHIDNINKFRTEAKMEKYKPENSKNISIRKVRKIEDHLRKS